MYHFQDQRNISDLFKSYSDPFLELKYDSKKDLNHLINQGKAVYF
jgi:hypothetical protein